MHRARRIFLDFGFMFCLSFLEVVFQDIQNISTSHMCGDEFGIVEVLCSGCNKKRIVKHNGSFIEIL